MRTDRQTNMKQYAVPATMQTRIKVTRDSRGGTQQGNFSFALNQCGQEAKSVWLPATSSP